MTKTSAHKPILYSIGFISTLLYVLLLLPASQATSIASLKPANNVTVFSLGEAGYFCIKIPYILRLDGTILLAFAEGRGRVGKPGCWDWAATDLVMKRSDDGGNTWGPLQVVYSNSSNTESNVIGNAGPVYLPDTGRILLPFCRNNLQVLFTYSDDKGQTWAPPVNVTGVIPANTTWIGLGPPAGLLMSTGRVVVPAYYSTSLLHDDGEFSNGYAIYSDDYGKTWHSGGSWSYGYAFPNENQCVEVSPNLLYFNSRGLESFRVQAWSHDGGETFVNASKVAGGVLPQPLEGCEGSTIVQPSTGHLFYSGPHDTSPFRYNMSVWRSTDKAHSWTHVSVVDPESSAYSALVSFDDDQGTIGLLYERQNTFNIIFQPDHIVYTTVWPPLPGPNISLS